MIEDCDIEEFYVFRRLGNSNEWGALMFGESMAGLPNVSFGIKIHAPNERVAIAKGKIVFDRQRRHNSHRLVVKDFMQAVAADYSGWVSTGQSVLEIAVSLTKDYEEYCNGLEKETIDTESV